MTPPIDVPNTDGLFDPAYATAVATHFYDDHFAILSEMREHGCNLFKRILATRAFQVEDLVMLGLLRQGLVGLDAWLLLANAGAGQAATTQTRGVWEAGLYIKWLKEKGIPRWGKQLYVANIRNGRIGQRRGIPGTPEQLAYAEACSNSGFAPQPVAADVVAEAVKVDEYNRLLLDGPEYQAINQQFEKLLASKGYEPLWHAPGPDGVSSIFKMAKALKMHAEYIMLYGPMSDATHGTRTDLHFKLDQDTGFPIFEPVRDPSLIGRDIQFLLPSMMLILSNMTTIYRPAEMDVFVAKTREWRPFFEVPKPKVNTIRDPIFTTGGREEKPK